MEETKAIAVRSAAEIAREDFMPVFTPKQALERKDQINEFIVTVMKPELDYGTIPGGNQKPVLLKPGAEKLCSIFGLAPHYEAEEIAEDWTGTNHGGEPFFYYRYKCRLYRGERCLGEAIGSGNSWESKYRWRDSKRLCPSCGQPAIIPGKAEWGGGWLCWKKQGGCGAKFDAADAAITGQQVGRIPNPDVADQINTIQKMAQKRALVAAVLVVTNCSDAFTQDLEDIDTGGHPVGTQAAADAVAQRKLSEMERQEEEGTPTELTRYFAAIDRTEPGAFTQACSFVQQEMIEADGVNGDKTFTEAGKKLRKLFEGKPIPATDCKRFLRAMWAEVLRMRLEREQRLKKAEVA